MRRLLVLVGIGACLTAATVLAVAFSHNTAVPHPNLYESGGVWPDNMTLETGSGLKAASAQLPKEAMVYRYISVDLGQSEVLALASKFDLPTSSVSSFKGTDGESYDVTAGDRHLTVDASTGEWDYLDGARVYRTPIADQSLVPSDELAREAAEKEIARLNLGRDGLEFVGVGRNMVSDQVVCKVVLFGQRINGALVAGASSIQVSVGEAGRIAGVINGMRPIAPYKVLELRPVAQALDEIERGECRSNMPDNATSASLDAVELAYFESSDPLTDQPYLQPVYRFTGKATTPSGETDFTAVAPALSY